MRFWSSPSACQGPAAAAAPSAALKHSPGWAVLQISGAGSFRNQFQGVAPDRGVARSPAGRNGLLGLVRRHTRPSAENLVTQRRRQLLAVIGEELRIMRATRNRNISHAAAEQISGRQFRIHVDQNALGGLPLAKMTCDRLTALP